MLSFLPGWLLLPFSFTLFSCNLALWGILVTPLGLIKLLLPFPAIHRLTALAGKGCYRGWTSGNTLLINLFNRADWQITGAQALDKASWYLLISNHKSWLDIPVVSTVAHSRIPEPKFFLKDELKWLPFLGTGCWALDMPFMKRYSAAQLAKYPHLKGKDIETTRKACRKFRFKPAAIMNFVEGTRFTTAKHSQQQSPFAHLLKPKAGGAAFVLGAMGEQLHKILDITIHYPQGIHSFWDYISGRVRDITVQIKVLPITPELLGDYNDTQYRERFQQWINQLWQQKDQQLAQLQQGVKQ